MNKYLRDLIRFEYKALAGRNSVNLFKIVLILFFTLVSLGISQGIMNHLAIKMKSPFINWIKLNIEANYLSDLKEGYDRKLFLQEISSPEIKKQFSLANIPPVFIKTDRNVKVSASEMSPLVQIETRTLNTNEPLFQELLQRNGLKPSDLEYNDKQISVILSKQGLNKVFAEGIPNYIYIHNSSSDERMPIRVAAVFEQLPDFADMVWTSNLYFDYYTFSPHEEIPSIWSTTMHLDYLKIGFNQKENLKESSKLQELIQIINKDHPLKPFWNEEEGFTDNLQTLTLQFENELEDTLEINNLFHKFIGNTSFGGNGIRIFNYPIPKNVENYTSNVDNFNYVSLKIEDIGNVKEFAAYLENKFNYKLSLQMIETFENYKSFEKTLLISASTIIALSILSLVTFILSTLLGHIERSKKTIGTIKAFGLTNSALIYVYLVITFIFIVAGLIISTTACAIFGPFLTQGITYAMHFNDAHNIEFSLLNYSVLFTIIAIFLSSSITVYLVLKRKFGKATPGDLVYEREN